MVLLYQLRAKEDKDDAVTDRGHGLDGILDSGVALLAQVLECISLDNNAIGNDTDDARPVEQLSNEECKVGRGEDDQRLHHPYMSGEPGHHTGIQAIDQSYTDPT